MVLRKLVLSVAILSIIFFSVCKASGIVVSLKHEGCGPEKKLFHKSQDVSLVVEGPGVQESDMLYLKPASKSANPCEGEGEPISIKKISENTFKSTKSIKADFTQTIFVCLKGQVLRRLPAYLFHPAVIPLSTFFVSVFCSLLVILPRPKTVLVLVVSGVLTFIFEELDEQLELPRVAIALFVALMMVYAARMALIPFLVGGTVILTATWQLALRFSCNNTFIRVMNALFAELKDTSNPVVHYIIMPLSPVVFAWLLLKALRDVKPSTAFASLIRPAEEDEDIRRSARPRSAPQRLSYKLEAAPSPRVARIVPTKTGATPKKVEIIHQATNQLSAKASPAAKSTPSAAAIAAATSKPGPSPAKSPAKKSPVATPSKATKRPADSEPEPKLSSSIGTPTTTPKKRKLLPM